MSILDQLRSSTTPEQIEAQQKKATQRWRANPKVIARESYGDRLLRLREEKLTKKPRNRGRCHVTAVWHRKVLILLDQLADPAPDHQRRSIEG